MTNEEGKRAVEIAKNAIKTYLSISKIQIPASVDNVFLKEGACFVTLLKDGDLRGCIGSILAYRPLVDDIVYNAISSAFKDPRFLPLSKDEFENIKIEVSILSTPKSLIYDGYEDLINKINQDIDGVIIEFNGHKATFLPSVWEQLNNKDDFFAHLCHKAGLSIDFYKSGNLNVEVYQTLKFS